MTAAIEPERAAWAYVSTVAQGPSRAIERLIASRGVLDAARGMRTGDVPADVWNRISARAHLDDAGQSLAAIAALGGRLVVPTDEEWPAWRFVAFDRVDDGSNRGEGAAPLALWVVGSAPVAQSTERSVAIVGTRAASGYGEHVTGEIAGDLAVEGWTVVSGGAYGIDGAAHRATLGTGGTTIAVLACGVDRAYPAGHERLLASIAERGAVISEYPPGTTLPDIGFLRVIASWRR